MPGCSVPQCTNHCRRGTRMFRFPSSPTRKKRWLAQVKRDRWEPTAAARVCAAHFEDSSFEQNRQDGLKKLRPDAVPTLFPYRAIPKHRKAPKKRAQGSTAIPSPPTLHGSTSDANRAASPMRACTVMATPLPEALDVTATDTAQSKRACAATAVPLPLTFDDSVTTKDNAPRSKRICAAADIPLQLALADITSNINNAAQFRYACAATAISMPLALDISASSTDNAPAKRACAVTIVSMPSAPDESATTTNSGSDTCCSSAAFLRQPVLDNSASDMDNAAQSEYASAVTAVRQPLAFDISASNTENALFMQDCTATAVSLPLAPNDSASTTDNAPRSKHTCTVTTVPRQQPPLDNGECDPDHHARSPLFITPEPRSELVCSTALEQPGGFPVPIVQELKEKLQPEVGSSEGLTSSSAVFTFGSSTTQSMLLMHRQNSELRKKNSDLARKYRTLQRLHDEAKSRLRSLTKKLTSAQKEISALKSSRFLNTDQTKALTVKSMKGHKWSEKTIRVALQIKHGCGTSGYELLRSLSYPLPSNRTLIRRLQHIKFLPGALDEVFEVLKRKVQTMEDIEKDCVLFMDEMEISQGFDHDSSLDRIFGSTTLPESRVNVANHALVFMVGGLNTRWKQVIAYHFTGRSTDDSALKELVFHLIELCFNISLKVLIVTSDMGSANRAVWRLLNFSNHRHSETVCSVPHPHLDGRQLYFMADPAHVLKNIRAQLLRSETFTLGEETLREHNLPGGTVDIHHVEAVLAYDANNELKIANRLSGIHVSNGHFTKMKVSIAVQLFREAPPAIRYLIQQKVLPPEAEATAWFFDLVTRWYTLMSSRHPMVALSHFDAAKHTEALGTLDLAITTFCRMDMGATAHWKPSQAGLLVSTTVVLRLSDELLNRHNYKYLLTGRLSQDCLENIFSVLRLRKPVPSAYDIKCALKLICVSQFLFTPTSSSYNVDDSMHLADLLDPALKKQVQDVNQESEELENLFVCDLTAVECDILAYLGGFILRFVKKSIGNCEDCEGVLVSDGNDTHSSLIHLKEYVKGAGNLVYPSQAVMSVLIECEENIKAFTQLDAILTLKAPFATILEFLRKSVTLELGCCDIHKACVEKILLEKYVRTRIRIHLRQQYAQEVNGASSKTCAAANLN
ncbi:uncharacterized protein LOC120843569 [Ixodes scapularis]|uniref:uncharacterized protein LOC120843569 n=1 Tax=Ixodes scapularis TaxID=6945 RepID=UPI001AD77142|nr:uncharacterized protein LOC120843569 [Ixodes scapularis]